MRHLKLLSLAMLAGCSADKGDANPPSDSSSRGPYATVLEAPVPDYSRLIAAGPYEPRGEVVREASSAPPPDAKAIGATWIERLEGRQALMGYGLAGKGPDGPVSGIDTLLTAREFDRWAAANGWSVPGHIAWRFQEEVSQPRVSDAAEGRIRYWPASTVRTGWQLEALEAGRIVLRDGCFRVQIPEQDEKLAWFHAETGLDADQEGYLILVNRVTGETMARVGEAMNWAGPNGVPEDSPGIAALHEACGPGEVHGVGNPQAQERMLTQYPHLREIRTPPPPPPAIRG